MPNSCIEANGNFASPIGAKKLDIADICHRIENNQ